MKHDFYVNLYVKICTTGSHFFKGREKKKDEKLNRELKFTRLPLQTNDVYAGAKLTAVILLVLMVFIDILILFPIVHVPMNESEGSYNSLDKNNDGIGDIVQDVEVLEDVEYDEFGFESERSIVGYQGKTAFSKMFLLIICPTLIVTYFGALFILIYPGSLARRMRLKSLASVPQTVNYLSMSLRLTPSLDTAVQYAGDNVKEPMAGSLKKILWDVYLRTHTTVEKAFIKFADEWGEFNESFKRSMYLLRASLLEKKDEGRRQVLDKANSVILSGVKLEINNFANSLKGPSMLMFAFGIILPIIIVTMLPIAGLGMQSIIWIIILMNVILPLVCFFYARRIIQNRPVLTLIESDNTSILERRKKIENKKESSARLPGFSFLKNKFIILTVSLFIVLMAIGSLIFSSQFSGIEPRYGSLIMILALSIPTAIFIYSSIRSLLQIRFRLQKMDSEFPDALFQLGTKIAEGRPLERAMEDTADAMKGTEIAKVFEGMLHRSRITRRSIHALITHNELGGMEVTSTILATMKVAVNAVEKNSAGAGEIIIDISNYLRDLRTMDELLKQRMKEVLQTIKQTGMIFAPVIIGLTTAMYFMLNANLAGLDFSGGFGFGGFGTADPIPGELFVLIFGIYLLLTISIITYFVTGIESSEDSILFRQRLSMGLVTAAGIFVIASLIGFQIFGV